MPGTILRLLLAAIVSVTAVSGQQAAYTLQVDVPFVAVDAVVTDAAGVAVKNLKVEDFAIYEDGVLQEIHAFSPASAPYNTFLLFDRSGSTQHKWPFMQKAVEAFVTNLRTHDRVAIATFDYEFEMLVDWNESREKALFALRKLIRTKAAGGTDFYKSVERAVRRHLKKWTGRRALVVLTDGRDTSMYRELAMKNRLPNSAQDRQFQRTLKAVREDRIPIYFVAVNTDKNSEPNTQAGDEYRNLQIIFPNTSVARQYQTEVRTRMELIAGISGGRILYPQRFEDIIPLYEQIGRDLGTAYSLGYVPSNPSRDGAFRRLEVKARDGSLRLIQSRTGYYAN